MSSDTAKENASVVDSSVTEKLDMRNYDDPESSSYKANEDGHPYVSEEAKAVHSNGRLENSVENKKGKLCNTRYFIIKSLNHHNLQLSIEKGIWATQVMNEPILEEAFNNSGKVILIFSVNMSGYFQGYAQMTSSVGWRQDNVWSRGNGKNNPWGRNFKVKWLQLNDLPFQKTIHLKNPLNDHKPVKISRDCQELPQDIGEALCDLLDGKDELDGMKTRDDLAGKRPCIEPGCSLGDEDYHISPLHMSLGRTPMPYPSILYQHQGGASNMHLAQGCGDTENFPFTSSKISRTCHSRRGNLSNIQVDDDTSARFDLWGLFANSPLASSITEDDFLEMTYEEYLEAHSRSIKQLCHPVGGPSWTTPESSSKKQNTDLNSSFEMDKSHRRKRTLLSSHR